MRARTRYGGKRQLTTVDKHRLAIARRTLELARPMLGVMGGMSKEEARNVIRELTGEIAGKGRRNPAGPIGDGLYQLNNGAIVLARPEDPSSPAHWLVKSQAEKYLHSGAVDTRHYLLYKPAGGRLIYLQYAGPDMWAGKRMKGNPGLMDAISPGDRVTIVNRFGQQRTGRAVMRSSHGGWVLNMGGPHGTPGIADESNTVKVSKAKGKRSARGGHFVFGNPMPVLRAPIRKELNKLLRQADRPQEAAAVLMDERLTPERAAMLFDNVIADPNVTGLDRVRLKAAVRRLTSGVVFSRVELAGDVAAAARQAIEGGQNNPRTSKDRSDLGIFLGWWTLGRTRFEVFKDQSDTRRGGSIGYWLNSPRGTVSALMRFHDSPTKLFASGLSRGGRYRATPGLAGVNFVEHSDGDLSVRLHGHDYLFTTRPEPAPWNNPPSAAWPRRRSRELGKAPNSLWLYRVSEDRGHPGFAGGMTLLAQINGAVWADQVEPFARELARHWRGTLILTAAPSEAKAAANVEAEYEGRLRGKVTSTRRINPTLYQQDVSRVPPQWHLLDPFGRALADLYGLSLDRARQVAQTVADVTGFSVEIKRQSGSAIGAAQRAPSVSTRRPRTGNPGRQPAALNRAIKTFRSWHGFAPSGARTMRAPRRTPEPLVALGTVPEIVYESDKWTGKKQTYVHKTKRPRPILATGPDGKGLFLVGGKVKVSPDGLLD